MLTGMEIVEAFAFGAGAAGSAWLISYGVAVARRLLNVTVGD